MNALSGYTQGHAVPLLHGDAGTAQTIGLARKLVDSALRDERVNAFAVSLVRDTPNYDDLAKVQAIYEWVRAHISYVMDPVGKEVLRNAVDTVNLGAGDCDDINAVLFPALLGSVGYSTRVVTVAVDPEDPTQFSHVYCEVDVNGEWVPLDAARPGARFGLAPSHVFKQKIWPMTGSEPQGIFGMRRRRGLLHGLAAMGDDTTNYAAIIAASGTAATQVINAAEENPYAAGTYSPYSPYATSPYSSFGAGSPTLGYPSAASLSLTGASSSSMMPLLLIGLLLFAFKD